MQASGASNVTDVLDKMDIEELQSIADYPSPGSVSYNASKLPIT